MLLAALSRSVARVVLFANLTRLPLSTLLAIAGEELSFSYVPADEPKADRNAVLKYKCAHSHRLLGIVPINRAMHVNNERKSRVGEEVTRGSAPRVFDNGYFPRLAAAFVQVLVRMRLPTVLEGDVTRAVRSCGGGEGTVKQRDGSALAVCVQCW